MTQFGYRTLGFGSGGVAGYNVEYLVVGGGASGSVGAAGGVGQGH